MGDAGFIENTLYLLALLNPASKILFLSAREPPLGPSALRYVALKSSLAAFVILVVFGWVGQFLLEHVFRIHLYSLKIAGGLVLASTGYNGVSKGIFVNQHLRRPVSDDDMSIVPLAAPLIAGPGTITAVIALSVQGGVATIVLPLATAIFLNYLCMLGSRRISAILGAVAMTGPLIRITGLMVLAIATELVLEGIADWKG